MKLNTYSLNQIAEMTHSNLVGDGSHIIKGIADLESAGPDDVSFLGSPLYEKAMQSSRAGAIFVSPQQTLPTGRNFLVSNDPSRSFQQMVELFVGEIRQTGFTGIHSTVVVHETAQIGKNTTIGPRAVIDAGVSIGDSTHIGAGCYIGPDTSIGTGCYLHPNVTIRERCQIGNRVILQPGAVIGSCGFGYTTDSKCRHIKLNQVGIVIIEDDVEIGANATVDRSRFKATKIGQGSKIDNLVQIGHGVIIGPHNIIIAQTGIAGSSETGSHVIIGGQVAIAGHLTVADQTMIAGKSGVTKSIIKSGKYGGIPALPITEYNRNSVHLRNIESLVNQIKELKARLDSSPPCK